MGPKPPPPSPLPSSLPRRTALKGLAALAGTSLLPLGCDPDPSAMGDDDATPDDDSSPSDDDTSPQGPGVIDTVVLVMMENRTFDHYFGSLSLEEGRKDVDGLSKEMFNRNGAGEEVHPFFLSDHCVEDPPHSWNGSHRQWNEGANDGFVTEHEDDVGPDEGRKVMGYHDRKQLPVYYALADHFSLCQRWFASVMGPTWPNRLFGHSGQSQGMTGNELPDNEDGTFGFTCKTIWEQLTEAGTSWTYYYTDLPFLALFAFAGKTENLKPLDQYFADAAAGTLPQVCWVDPGFGYNDDHPPHHIGLGQMFLGTVFQALGQSSQWNRSLFIVTSDEHGGFFDHVPPPTTEDDLADQGFDQLGFRVPTVVAGPYVKEGHVSSEVRNHASWIRHVEGMFGISPLNTRVSAATDLSELIDAERLAQGKAFPAPATPFIELTMDEAEAQCDGEAFSQPELARLFDRGLLPSSWDRRPHRRADLLALGRHAERLGVGRIKG